MTHLQSLCCGPQSSSAIPPRRGLAGQRPQRALEQQARLHVVDFSNWTQARGWTLGDTAAILDLSERSLRDWRQRLHGGAVPLQALGRPLLRSPCAARNEVLDLLQELGPATSLATLRACFPALPPAELHDLLVRYRRVLRRRYHDLAYVLQWPVAGSVWAIDFAQPPRPIDGRYGYLLAVRDLASGQQLLWQPVREATAAVTCQALAPLFALHGAPLVLKMDNGCTFIAGATLALLHSAGVIPLFSPPYLPSYNGSIEAGIGSLKSRTEYHASRQDHGGCWSWDDVAAAQAEANATARPRGPQQATPAEAWAARPRLPASSRILFQASVTRYREEAHLEEDLVREGPLDEKVERALDRKAIRRALVGHGYLLFRRRRIPLPIRGQKAARIT
jgi:transposase InsO family protein